MASDQNYDIENALKLNQFSPKLIQRVILDVFFFLNYEVFSKYYSHVNVKPYVLAAKWF